MRRKELVKRTGAIMLAGMMACCNVPAAAQENNTAGAEIGAEETTEAADEQSDAEASPEFVMPEIVALEGEKTEVETGVIEKFTKDIIVEEDTKGQVEFLVYTPSDVRPVGPSTPAVMVYGNQTMTESDAAAMLAASGLDAVAKKENCSVMFVNPVGDTWGEADLEAYLYALIDLWSEDTGSTTGKTEQGDKLIGSTQRLYVIADGSGADFAAKYLTQNGVKKFNLFADFYYLPAGEILFNTSISTVACGFGMPAALSGGSEELVAAWKKMNGADREETVENGMMYTSTENSLKNLLVMDAAESFDMDTLTAGWKLISGARRQLTGYESPDSYELLPMYNFEEYGISVNIETAELSSSLIEWYEYIPEEVDLNAEGSVPLVFTFHGGGNHAEYQANASEWPLIGKENGFITVAVNQHVEHPASDIVELLGILEEKYPAIDRTRIYASGFSMGSLKSWECGMQYPELFAGIAPMDAVEEPVWELKKSIIPTYYLAGEEDGLLVFPHQAAFGGEGGEGDGDYILQRLFEMNQIEYQGYDETINPIWGMEFDETKTVDTTGNGLHVVTENYLTSADGNTYTVLASMSNQAHAVLAGSARSAWEFLKQFSRNEDGTVSINQ